MALTSSPGHYQTSFAALGDPHFTGFDGSFFEYQGECNKYYNIISSKNFQLNSLFTNWPTTPGATAMREVGVKVKTDSGFTEIRFDESGKSYVNGENLSEFKSGDFYFGIKQKESNEVYINYLENKAEGIGLFINGFIICFKGLEIFISYETDNVNAPYYNIVGKHNNEMELHGVVGQTANPNLNRNENFQDFEVSSLFGSNFKYNLLEN
jgi:hypothetical protein